MVGVGSRHLSPTHPSRGAGFGGVIGVETRSAGKWWFDSVVFRTHGTNKVLASFAIVIGVDALGVGLSEVWPVLALATCPFVIRGGCSHRGRDWRGGGRNKRDYRTIESSS